MNAAASTGKTPGPSPPVLVRFGVFEANLTTRELRKHGTLIHLPDQPFRILARLVERPGEVVTREELRRTLWPEHTYVDFDRCLNTAMNRLRAALNDSADQPRFIQTLPRRGYRFLAPVERTGGSASEDSAAGEPASIPAPLEVRPRPRARWQFFLVVTTVLAVSIGGILLLVRPRRDLRQVSRPVSETLTDYRGAELTPACSPDGRAVAFTWNGPNRANFDIYVRRVGSRTPLRLTTSPAEDFGPCYSPDGTRLAFYRRSGDSSALYVSSLRPDTAVRLASLGVGPDGPLASGMDTETLSWSPDGKALAYVDKPSPRDPYSVFLLWIETRRQERLTWPPAGSAGDGSPRFSPDGRTLAFVRRETASSGDIYLSSLDGSSTRRVTSDRCRISGLAWAPDGRSILFASDREFQAMRLWRVSLSGGAPALLAGVREEAATPSLPLRGQGLVYVRWSRRPQVWRLPLPPRDGSAEPIAVPGSPSTPQISPDGLRLAWTAEQAGSTEIWTGDATGGQAALLAKLGPRCGSPQWSPDGREIAFDSFARGNWDIYVVDARGGQPRALTTHPGEDVRPSWSADGQFIYFGSDRSGTMQVWKARRDGSEARQVTRHGGYQAQESADGRFLYYVRRGMPGLWQVPVGGGVERLVLPELQWENSRNWVVSSVGVYFLAWEGERPSERTYVLRLFRPENRRVAQIRALGRAQILDSGCSLPRDGTWFYHVRQIEDDPDIALLPRLP